ncbi:MAG: UDP-2,3-diacylglucosamine diphosphatase LpxI [Planctomycetales bacterium]
MNSIPSIPLANQRIGLLAGAGRFPIAFAEAARARGLSVCCVGIEGLASPELMSLCDEYHRCGLAKIGRAIRLFRRSQVSLAVMAGKIEKTVLFNPFRWVRLLPDWRAFHMWVHYAKRDKRDDTILMAIIQEFQRDNIDFGSALDICPNLLIERGLLSKKKPSSPQWDDIHFGWEIAKEMGRLDIGQSVIVKDKAVIAVEAIEGTDKAIQRAGELCRQGGFTVVKVAKPQQDMRFDVPTVGVKTIQTIAQAGGKVLAIECEKTIVLDREEVLRLANKHGIAIVSFNALDMQQRLTA